MQNNQQMGGMPQLDMAQLSNLLRMYGMGQQIPQMPQQQIPPQMYQTRQMQPAAMTSGPSMMYGQQPQQQMQSSAGLQIPPGYTYDPRNTQYGIPGGANNLQYTYPGGVTGAGAYRPHTG